MVPDALVPVIIVIAIVAVLRGDAPIPHVLKIMMTLTIVAVIGLAILYVPSWLYEQILNRDSPSWLTIATAIPALILAFATHLFVTLPPPRRLNNPESTNHDS